MNKFIYRKFIRPLKFLWQRLSRGWADSDCWNLYITIAEFVLPRLKRLKELQTGHPAGITEHQWQVALDKMINSFQIIVDDLDCIDPEENKVINEGLKLFATYFTALWD